MANYNKPSVGPAWAETANNPADIIPVDPAFVSAGWPLTGIPPSRQRMNYIFNWLANAVRYFMQRGLVDYDVAETYRSGSAVIGDDGNTYRSLVDGNVGNAPSSSPTQWTLWALTLPQINNAQLTQANIAGGDSTSKVANTNFVQSAINSLSATLTGVINASVAGLNAAIATAQNTANAANAAAAAAQGTANGAQASANGAQTTANAAISEIAGLRVTGTQNITAGKAFGTVYQNNSGSMRMVSITGHVGSGGGSMSGFSGTDAALVAAGDPSTSVCTQSRVSASNSNPDFSMCMFFMVPPGYFYMGGSFQMLLGAWTEWDMAL